MKLASRIICIVLLSITILLSTVFAFIEFRSLIAGDYSLMNNAAMGFATYLLRGLFFVSLLSFSLLLLDINIKGKDMMFIHYFVGACLLIGSLFSVGFYSTYIYFAVIFISLVPNITFVLRRLFSK